MEPLVLLGLLPGLLYGFIAQRGRFCLNAGLRQLLVGSYARFNALLLAVALQTTLINIFALFGVLRIDALPLHLVGAAVGGLLFGLGMTFAGGCASGIFYKLGEGQGRALFSILGFSLSSYLCYRLGWGKTQGFELLSREGEAASLPSILQLPRLMVALGVVGLCWLWLKDRPDRVMKGGWSWRRTGLCMGLLGTLTWLLALPLGRHFGITITDGALQWVHFFDVGGQALQRSEGFSAFFVLALPVGALLGALVGHEFRFRPPTPQKAIEGFCGGILLGVGAILAWGCTIGHGLTGVSALSAVSFWAMGFITLGAWAGELLERRRTKRTAEDGSEKSDDRG